MDTHLAIIDWLEITEPIRESIEFHRKLCRKSP
jgi:hypothetical protein